MACYVEESWLDPNDHRLKENYRPITVQVTVNKVFEQLLSIQLSTKFESRFSGNLTACKRIFPSYLGFEFLTPWLTPTQTLEWKIM